MWHRLRHCVFKHITWYANSRTTKSILGRCLMVTIADYYPANVMFGKSWRFWWISPFLFSPSHYFLHLIFVLAYFIESLTYSFKCLLLQRLQLLLSKCKQIQKIVFSGCKNRICHHKFKLDAWNNGWTKKEVRIFIRISVISRILLWLDYNRQLSPWDI